mmetsp:Transcript_65283/g.187838  ORF Transcript_65283/g.187838 Transcript_65283/m.187838 type:complete len:467 (+) Transcript_65283:745-2145(+)
MEVEHEYAATTSIGKHLSLLVLGQDGVRRIGKPLHDGLCSVQAEGEHLQVLELQGLVICLVIRDAEVGKAVAGPRKVRAVDLATLGAHPGQDAVGAQGGGQQLSLLQHREAAVHQDVVVEHAHAISVRAQELGGQAGALHVACCSGERARRQVHLLVVDVQRLRGDERPIELVQCLVAGPRAHPTGVLEILADLADAPGDAAGVGVDEVPVLIWGHEVARTAACRGHHGLARGPGLKHDDAEGLVTAGHDDGVARLEESLQVRGATLDRAREVHRMADASPYRLGLERGLHVAVAHEHKLGIGAHLQDHGDRIQEKIGALLHRQSAHEQKHRCHDVEALVPLGVACPLVLPRHVYDGACVDAVVDHLHLPAIDAVVRTHLLLEHTAHRDDALSGVAGLALDGADAGALPAVGDVAAAARLGRVHREDTPPAHGLQLAHGRAHEPVVAVHHVEAPEVALHVEEVADE